MDITPAFERWASVPFRNNIPNDANLNGVSVCVLRELEKFTDACGCKKIRSAHAYFGATGALTFLELELLLTTGVAEFIFDNDSSEHIMLSDELRAALGNNATTNVVSLLKRWLTQGFLQT